MNTREEYHWEQNVTDLHELLALFVRVHYVTVFHVIQRDIKNRVPFSRVLSGELHIHATNFVEHPHDRGLLDSRKRISEKTNAYGKGAPDPWSLKISLRLAIVRFGLSVKDSLNKDRSQRSEMASRTNVRT